MIYHQQFYLYNGRRNLSVSIRNYQEADFGELIEVQKACFPPPFPSELWWNKEQLQNHVSLFPEGAICVEVEGKIVGSMTGLLVSFDPADITHTWEDITDNGYIRNHDSKGNSLYVVDICVHPEFRKLDLGKWMMQAMYQVVVHLNLDRLIGGGRIPGYHKVANEMSVDNYVQLVIKGERKDPVLSFLLRCGRTPLGIVKDYLDDEESHNSAVLMEWKNPFRY